MRPPREGYINKGKVWTKNSIKRIYKRAVALAKDLNLPIPRRPTPRCTKCGRKEFGWCECE
jgi:hypothetical protein